MKLWLKWGSKLWTRNHGYSAETRQINQTSKPLFPERQGATIKLYKALGKLGIRRKYDFLGSLSKWRPQNPTKPAKGDGNFGVVL